MRLSVFWFRRDLRLDDNVALYYALKSKYNVLPVYIFDINILDQLPKDDARITFMYDRLIDINNNLNKNGASILCLKGDPVDVWSKLIEKFDISEVYINKDYEPGSISRDSKVEKILEASGIKLFRFKDQVIFEEDEVVKSDGSPYTVFTPYKRKFLQKYVYDKLNTYSSELLDNYYKADYHLPAISDIGFIRSKLRVKKYNISELDEYAEKRDYPAADITSYIGPHLRYGTVSIRKIVSMLEPKNIVYLSELIWREFFMQILYHFPDVARGNFKRKYDNIEWRNNEYEFNRWCNGQTGYPIVDAGMKELNTTGYMHNRVRMIAASFLCKHLLVDWRWGEAYFAEKLLDYDLSANNGNWQWVASTGCDSVPYFRIFNPDLQLKKFDKDYLYVKKWIPNFDPDNYIAKIVEHKFARKRALAAYGKVLAR